MSAPLSPERDAEARQHLDSLSLDRRTGVAEVFAKYATATDDIGQAALVHLQWALTELAARPSRAEVLREAADALEARVADVDVDPRTTWAGMDAAYLRAMADEAATGGAS
jgi:hypothetical protein